MENQEVHTEVFSNVFENSDRVTQFIKSIISAGFTIKQVNIVCRAAYYGDLWYVLVIAVKEQIGQGW